MLQTIRYFQIFLLGILEILLVYENSTLPSESEMSVGVITTNVIIILISTIIFLSHQNNPKYLRGQIITISYIFLFSFFVVHFFNYIGWLFTPGEYKFLSTYFINKASTLSAASYIGCLIGMKMCEHPFKDTNLKKRLHIPKISPFVMVLFLALFIIFTDKRYFSAGGNSAIINDVGWNPIGSASYNMCVAYVIANVVVVTFNNRGKKMSLKHYYHKYSAAFYILTFIYLLIVLISGDRGPMLDIFIAYFLGYIIINKKKPKPIVLITVAIVAIFSLTFLSFLRNNTDELSIEKLESVNERMSRFHENNIPIIGDLRELSDVVNSYHMVYEFGERYTIIYGAGTITQILAILPGIRFLIVNATGINPALFSTSEIATTMLGKSYGAGTTCVADAYYNFGFYGSIIFFIIVGYILRKLDLSIYQKGCKLFIFIVGFCFFVKSIYLGRSYVLQPITLIMYTYIIVLVSKYINNLKAKSNENYFIYR